MLNLPLSIIGGVVGVYLAGGVVTIASIIGFITVFGVAARNGIMMVSHGWPVARPHTPLDGCTVAPMPRKVSG